MMKNETAYKKFADQIEELTERGLLYISKDGDNYSAEIPSGDTGFVVRRVNGHEIGTRTKVTSKEQYREVIASFGGGFGPK